MQCYGSPGVNRVNLIELAAPIGAMPWNGSSASFCSPAAAAAVIYGSSNSAGLSIAKDSGDGGKCCRDLRNDYVRLTEAMIRGVAEESSDTEPQGF